MAAMAISSGDRGEKRHLEGLDRQHGQALGPEQRPRGSGDAPSRLSAPYLRSNPVPMARPVKAVDMTAERAKVKHPVAELDQPVAAHLAGDHQAVVSAARERGAAQPGCREPHRSAGDHDADVGDQRGEEHPAYGGSGFKGSGFSGSSDCGDAESGISRTREPGTRNR